jgi:phosphate-selective porin OprO/OprP
MRLRRCFGFVAVLGLVAATTQLVFAQQAYVSDDTTLSERVGVQDERIADQNQRIAELEALLTQREQPFQMRPASWNYDSMMSRIEALELAGKGDGKDGDGKDGKGWIDAHDQVWTHQIGGRLLFDYVQFSAQDPDSDTLFGDLQNYTEFRSARLFVEGCGYGVYDYKLEVDFTSEQANWSDPGIRIQDAYLGIRDIPILGRVAFGNQKVPFGLEAQSRLENLTFMERGLPVENAGRDFGPVDPVFTGFPGLWPGDDDVQLRRVGIAAYNASDCPKWHVSYGVFFEDMDTLITERPDDRQGFSAAARGVWLPYYANDGRHFAHIGAGVEYVDDRDDLVYFAARPEVHEVPPATFFNVKTVTVDSGILAADDYARFNLEGALVNGPLSLQGELFYTRVDDVGGDYYGAYAYASYFLTGEHRGYDPFMARFERVKPLENFWIVNTPDGNCIGSGAWEVAFRWSWVDYADAIGTPADGATPFFAFPAADLSGVQTDFTVGLNWYWNPHARMMLNYIHAFNSYSIAPAAALTPDVGILALRWQVDF